jgi:hypothetical protein
LTIQLWKKKILSTRGEMNQNGGWFHPINEKMKNNKVVYGMHAALLISQEEGLWAE